MSKGDGTFAQTFSTVGCCIFGEPPRNNWDFVLGDFNGDGRTDFAMIGGVASTATQQFVFMSNGDGSFARSFSTLGCCVFGAPPRNNWAIVNGDFNGDGKTDFALLGGANATGVFASLANGQATDLVSTISNGLSAGAVLNVTYSPATKSSVYTKGNSASYPQQDMQAPTYLASRVDKANGLGGSYSATYSYAGAKLDLRGRGFLGFGQTAVTDLQTNVVQTTSYRQDFPYIGMVGATKTMLNALILNQTTNTFQFSNASGAAGVGAPTIAGAPYRVSVSQSVAQSVDLDGSTVPTATTSYQYDAYGNATQVVVSTPDGFSKTTANTYTNDTARWLLGRLNASSMTSVSP